MNSFAARGVEAGFGRMKKPRLSRRPRTFVAALIGTWVLFMWFASHYYKRDDSVVWIWMGMRSDSRCGRDFGTDHVKETTCGKGSCCSSHGWCGVSEEYCSVALGCQNGCWPVDEEEQKKIDAKKDMEYDDDDHYHGYRGHGDDDDYSHRHYRYDDDPYHQQHYRHGRGHYDDDEGYPDYNHRYDEDSDYHDDHDHDHDHDHHHDELHDQHDDEHDDGYHDHHAEDDEGGKHGGHYDGHYDEHYDEHHDDGHHVDEEAHH